MTRMRRAALILAPVLCALALTPLLARADGGAPVRIRDLRVGEHSGYERLVIELDADAEVVWENGPEPGEESFYIAAAPQQRSRVIVTQLPHVGTISVTEMKGGTHVAVEPRARRVRAYTLANPPRLVVDFAAPAKGTFDAPAGARALEPARSLGPLVVEPEPEPLPEPEREPEAEPQPAPKAGPEITAEPAQPAPQLEAPPAPEPEPEPAAEPAPVPAPTPEPAAEPAPVPAPTPEPTPAPVAKPAASAGTPEPEPQVVPAKPVAPKPAAPSPSAGFPYALALGALLGLALAIGAATALLRRRAARSEPSSSRFPPEEEDALPARGTDDISPADVLAAAEHDGALAKRLDEEVRARLELEQRFAHANEELKVLRDRLHRLERRREGAS